MFILQSLSSVPSSFLIVLSALRSMDPALEEAASVSGVSWLTTIRRVTLPMMLPAILSAAIYTGMNIAETFEIPALIGVPIGFHVLSSQVYLSLRVWGNHTVASAYSVIFLIMLIGLVYLYQKATRHGFRYATISGKGYRPKLITIGRWKYFASGMLTIYLVVTLGLPFFILVWSSLFPTWQTPSLEMMSKVNLDSYREVFGNANFLDSVKNTLILMLVTPVITVALISVASWLIVRSNLSLKWKALLDTLTFWPHAYPGIVLGVALLCVFYYRQRSAGVGHAVADHLGADDFLHAVQRADFERRLHPSSSGARAGGLRQRRQLVYHVHARHLTAGVTRAHLRRALGRHPCYALAHRADVLNHKGQ